MADSQDYRAKLLQEKHKRELDHARKFTKFQPRNKAEFEDWLIGALGFEFSKGKLIFSTQAVQEGQMPPFLWMWELYCLGNGRDPSWEKLTRRQLDEVQKSFVFWSTRGGMKTLGFACTWFTLCYWISNYSVVHAAAEIEQGNVCISYFKDNWAEGDLFREDVTVTGRDTARKIKFRNGSELFTCTASVKGFNAIHTKSLSVDEVELMKWDVLSEALMIPMQSPGDSLPSLILLGSTQKYAGATMSKLIKECAAGKHKLIFWNCFEVTERCPDHRTEKLPEDLQCSDFDGLTRLVDELGSKPTQLTAQEHEALEGAQHYLGVLKDNCPLVHYCKGICKRTTGHMAINDLIKGMAMGKEKFEAQVLCRRPAVEGAIFPTFGPDNITEDAIYREQHPVASGHDYGFVEPCFGLWACLNGPYVDIFQEFEAVNMGAPDQAKYYKAFYEKYRQDYAVVDPAATELINEMRKLKMRIYASRKKIAVGLEAMGTAICNAEDFRSLRIHPKCERLIDTIYSYLKDENGNPRGKQWDHSVDACRYLLLHLSRFAKYKPGIRQRPNPAGHSMVRRYTPLKSLDRWGGKIN